MGGVWVRFMFILKVNHLYIKSLKKIKHNFIILTNILAQFKLSCIRFN